MSEHGAGTREEWLAAHRQRDGQLRFGIVSSPAIMRISARLAGARAFGDEGSRADARNLGKPLVKPAGASVEQRSPALLGMVIARLVWASCREHRSGRVVHPEWRA